MRVIPVLDVRQGQAVRAVSGHRAHYGPLRSVLFTGSDPIELARLGRSTWGLPDLYLADLDAILGEAPPRLDLFRDLQNLGLTLWVDAGVRQADQIGPLIEAGVGRVILGLETIRGPEVLAKAVEEVGAGSVVFSLDLRRGRPMVDTRPAWGTDLAEEIAGLAIEAGAGSLIHLDLDRVGTGRGVGSSVGPLVPGVEWIIGGGIAGIAEVRELARQGFAGVLVGSSLHDGRITAADLDFSTG